MSALRSFLAPGVVLLALFAGCSAPGAVSDSRAPDLLASLQVSTFVDSVRFDLQVTNTTAEAAALEFSSGQRFDFVVERDGSELWRWADDRMFTQALERESLPAGETLTYSATWQPPASLQGELTVRGILTASRHRLEQEAGFRIP